MRTSYRTRWIVLSAILVLAMVSMSCQLSLIDLGLGGGTPVPGGGNSGTPTPAPLAEVTFTVSIPAPLVAGESMTIGILDEVTGLGLNPVVYPMTAVDAQHYTVKLPIALNSQVKYRYYRQGAVPAQETTPLNIPVRYRVFYVTSPGSTDDRVSSWSDSKFNGQVGRINGTVLDAGTGRPIPNIMVNAGGVTTLTDSLGQYVLEAMSVGTHTLVASALDGSYVPFQQGASVLAGQTTPAQFSMKAAATVQVTFIAGMPSDSVGGAPVRLAGNLIQLGNTFADLRGGVSTVATRMPTLTPLQDGRHSVTLRLPVGADIRYKYTLGDGFWNAEHGSNAAFVLRQLIVPPNDTVVQDTIATWQAGTQSAPILFDVTVPGNTPVGENVSIQFNPFGWTEPIPMWPLGNHRWVYKLYSPLNVLGAFHYRYCRNDQCGSADDVQTVGDSSGGRSVNTSLLGENIQENINGWNWWPESEPTTLIAVPVNARKGAFWAGVEFSTHYAPNWQALLPSAMQNVQALGSNYVVLTPTWTATSYNPLVFAPTPGSDPLWADTLQAVQYGRAQNLNVAIYATPRLYPSNVEFWLRAPRTPEWWNSWFERYRAFALYHADLAAQSGSQALILGGDAVFPSLPGGTLADGSSSGVPADADARWRALLAEVHQRFSGQLLWAHPYGGGAIHPAPAFIDQFYAVYLLWSAPLAANPSATVETMTNDAVAKLDNDVAPFLLAAQKGVVVGVDYPSAQGAASGCVPAGGGGCLDWNGLSRPYPDIPAAGLDLKGQADLYQALLQAANQREWVGGFISRGYYPPLPLMDKSSSVRGKPTADLLWYWFPRMTGVTK